MKWYYVVAICFLALLTTSIGIRSRIKAANYSAKSQASIEVVQLPEQDGTIPVEIKDAAVTDEGIKFAAQNNTQKLVDVVVVLVSGKLLDKSGKYEQNFGYTVDFNYSIGSIAQAHEKMRPKGFREQFIFGPDPIDFPGFEDGKVKSLNLRIDYVEFTDATAIGAGTKTAARIASIKEGARKYQEWLDRFDVSERANALKRKEMPAEIHFEGEHERLGAKKLRVHLLNSQHHHQ